ncbi:MAG: hypothetical protein HOP95_10555 [Sphingomonas sp.]|nr:hypothetical protein [Sphingomonas sp.]
MVLNVYQHGNKVFNLYKGKPIAAMTCGMGHMGQASISTLAKDFRRMITKGVGGEAIDPETYTIEEVVRRAHDFFAARYAEIEPAPANPHGFEFSVGGYGAGRDNSEVWKISIYDGDVRAPELIVAEGITGNVAWGGQPKPLSRLIFGFDPDIGQALSAAGLPEEAIEPLVEQLRQRLTTPLVEPAMPIGDAIALADFMVDLTKKYFAFLPQADVVGGATDIATVTKHEGFKWIRRKHHYPAELNPRETDHV